MQNSASRQENKGGWPQLAATGRNWPQLAATGRNFFAGLEVCKHPDSLSPLRTALLQGTPSGIAKRILHKHSPFREPAHRKQSPRDESPHRAFGHAKQRGRLVVGDELAGALRFHSPAIQSLIWA